VTIGSLDTEEDLVARRANSLRALEKVIKRAVFWAVWNHKSALKLAGANLNVIGRKE
jgi:hypothetical protein